jgi:uncharacterized protein DUF87
MVEAVTQQVGLIEGEATSTNIQIRVTIESIGRNDLVEAHHEGKSYLLIVKEAKRLKEHYQATCEVIGRGPKTPFKPGQPVFNASEESIRDVYGLLANEKEGLFLGWLRGLQTKIWIPVEKLGRTFIVGKPGSGKSYTAGVITEELLKKGIPVLIVDVHGEYSSLKVSAQSKARRPPAEEIDYADRVLEFGDTALSPGADLEIGIVESARPEELLVSGQCTILNLRGLKEEQQEALVSHTISKVLDAAIAGKVKPFYCLLDEAHRFAGRERSETVDVLKKFTQEGRKFGANLIVITQRPQLLDVTVRSLSGTWLIHRLTDPNDTKIAAESGGLSKEWEHDINWLESGEAIVTGEIAEKLPFVVKVRPRETKHGAPGFNPLDFVSPEVLEKIKQRKDQLKSRLVPTESAVSAPTKKQAEFHVAETLKQTYLPDNQTEAQVLRRIKRSYQLEDASFKAHTTELVPCLYLQATVSVSRNNPEVSITKQVRSLSDASASAASIEFSGESALGLAFSDVEKSAEKSEKSDNSIMRIPPAKALQGISEFERLKKDFLTYVTQANSITILKHPRLDLVSEPDASSDQFMPKVRESLQGQRKLEREKLEKKFMARTSKQKKLIAKIESDIRLTSRYIEEVGKQTGQLKNQKGKAQKQKKSVNQISDRLYKTELKLTNLQSKQQELAAKLAEERKGLEETQNQLRFEIEESEDRLEQFAKENLKAVHVKPNPDEVEVSSAQLVWVPLHRAHLSVGEKERENEIEVWWNGYTGEGSFGRCSVCGETIREGSGKRLCQIGLEPICEKHTLSCSACGKSICKKHSWTCKTCGKICCSEEKHVTCATCKGTIGTNHALKCIICGDKKDYCDEHVKKCGECGQRYCEKHFDEHIGKCVQCSKAVCTIKHAKCAICGSSMCEEHSSSCAKCKRSVCPADSWKCPQCKSLYCTDEKATTCKHCSKNYCENCINPCSICSDPVCQDGLKPCAKCGRMVCSDCTVSQRSFLVLKKKICKVCAKEA